MNIFSLLDLLGGLAMFLYGMRLMGDGLKEGSSGTLKIVMENVTNNPFKAFMLGLLVTAIIQSSTATIVITSGLVAAGILSLHQSLGIIVGANVGTTMTGQIIRLLDLDGGAVGWLQLFRPSTLAPVALIIGIIMIMAKPVKNARIIGTVAIGFGILFTGLMNMTGAVDILSEQGVFDPLLESLGSNPLVGYSTGALVAFILQSSSATIGILQAFSATGMLAFNAVYAVIVGVYLGDCVTTAIVCSIGASSESKRVGIVNILFNLAKSVLVFAAIFALKAIGALDSIWEATVNPGFIANANSIFNMACALVLLPTLPLLEKSSYRIIKDDPSIANKYKEKLESLNHNFFKTPALALRSCYDVLMTVYELASANISKALTLFVEYNDNTYNEVLRTEKDIDLLTDEVGDYLSALSKYIASRAHAAILDNYYRVTPEFERLGDYAVNLARTAKDLHDKKKKFSAKALHDLSVLTDLLKEVLKYAEVTFRRRSMETAKMIEPLEQVVDDAVDLLRDNHLQRLRKGECGVTVGTDFMNVLGDIERISDICSNIGLATIIRINQSLAHQEHKYIHRLHSGEDEEFNREYNKAHNIYISRLKPAKEEA